MKKRHFGVWVALVVGAMGMVLTACGGKTDFANLKLKDGTYQGHYRDEEDGASASEVLVTLTIKDGKIDACESIEKLITAPAAKDESYGKNAGDQNYQKAQIAVKGIRQYQQKLVEVQDPEKVDAISGATVSQIRFKAAVWDALNQA